MTEAVAQYDWDAYVAGEAHSEIRHEFVGGRLYAMAGGTERHDMLAGMLFRQLDDVAEREGPLFVEVDELYDRLDRRATS